MCTGALAALSSGAGAQDFFPSLTRHYKFLPRLSVLNQQGGFAGFDVDCNVVGTFDFITTPSPLAVFPPIIIGDFDNVDAAGVRGFQNYAIKLDDAINLSGLKGSSRIGGPTTVFHFTGKTQDESSVDLWAATRGPWLYMRGATTPPPGSADFFEYHIKALSHARPFADTNDDGVVDGADLDRITAPSGFRGSDFLDWQRQFGETPPPEAEFESAIAAASANLAAVPEPGMAVIVLGGVVLLAAARRK
jgi:hypothetical protein